MIMKRTSPAKPTERRFRAASHVAMGLLGWLLPDTEAVVRATTLNDEVRHDELPEELKDPLAVFDRDRVKVY